MGVKVILVNSPLFREKRNKTENYLPPMGLGYIATQLEQIDCDVILLDSVNEDLGVSEIIDFIASERPEYVGLNVFTTNMEIVKEIVEKIDIDTNIVLGGKVVEYIYQEIFNWKTKNTIICIIGDGELIWPAIVAKDTKGQPIIKNENRYLYEVDEDSCYYPND